MHSAIRARRAGEAQQRTDDHLRRIGAALSITDIEELRQAPPRVREPQDLILHEREGVERVLARIADVLEGATAATPAPSPEPNLDLAVAAATLAMYFGVATFEELNGKPCTEADITALLTGCVDRLRSSIVDQSITVPDEPPASDEDPLDILRQLATGEGLAPHELMRLDLDCIPAEALAAFGWQLVDVVDGEGEGEAGDDAETVPATEDADDDTADSAEKPPEAAPKAKSSRRRTASSAEE